MDQITKDSETLYNELKFGNFSYGQKREKFDPLLFSFLRMVKEEHKLFEVGCGNGYWLNTYLRLRIKKKQITAIDLAPENIERLKTEGFNAVCDNGLELKLDSNISDFTICSGVLHHMSNPCQGFSELVRITKPGGYIYLNVYNKWHPFFYFVHKATIPIRYCYWNWNKKVFDIIYPISKIIFQPLAYFALGEFLDDETGKTHFKDQVLTPQAHLLSKGDIKKLAEKTKCSIEQFQYNRYGLMIAAIIRKNS